MTGCMLSAWQFAVAVEVLRQKLTALEESNDALAERIVRLRETLDDDKRQVKLMKPAQ